MGCQIFGTKSMTLAQMTMKNKEWDGCQEIKPLKAIIILSLIKTENA